MFANRESLLDRQYCWNRDQWFVYSKWWASWFSIQQQTVWRCIQPVILCQLPDARGQTDGLICMPSSANEISKKPTNTLRELIAAQFISLHIILYSIRNTKRWTCHSSMTNTYCNREYDHLNANEWWRYAIFEIEEPTREFGVKSYIKRFSELRARFELVGLDTIAEPNTDINVYKLLCFPIVVAASWRRRRRRNGRSEFGESSVKPLHEIKPHLSRVKHNSVRLTFSAAQQTKHSPKYTRTRKHQPPSSHRLHIHCRWWRVASTMRRHANIIRNHLLRPRQ